MSLNSSPQVNEIVQANNEVNSTWLLRYHKCFQLWITVKWPRSYILNITLVFMYLMLSGYPRYYIRKWKVNHPERRLKSLSKEHSASVLKSLGCVSSQNVSYSKLKLNTLVSWGSLGNSASFSVGQPKPSIKLELLNWPPCITASAKNSIPNLTRWSSNYFFCLHTRRLSNASRTWIIDFVGLLLP